MEGHKSKRVLAITLGGGGLLLAAGIAFAYWSTLGSGTGTAGVGTDEGVSVTQDSTITGLAPGGAAQAINFTVTNDSASTPVDIKSVVIGFGSFAAGCSAADFTLVQPTKPSVGTPLSIAPSGSLAFTSDGSGSTGGTGASIAMNNTGSNQDACKSTTVNLTYNVS